VSGPTVGALFAGYGGLELAVTDAIPGAHPAWLAELDPAASRVLATRFPGVPNLGDITAIGWDDVPRVDIIAGGFPCQDVSHAGRRAGLASGTRSGLWARMADAIAILRPALVVAENVRGLLSAQADSDVEPCPWCLGETGDGEPALRALGAVLADLADIGYDAAWHGLRAADIGAPHGRFRVFIVAWPAADADRLGHERSGLARGRRSRSADGGLTPADAQGDGRDEGRSEPARLVGGPDAAERGDAAPDADGDGLARLRGWDSFECDVDGCGRKDESRASTEPATRPIVAGQNGLTPERMMGYLGHADATQGRPDQALRDLRRSHGTQAFQRETRGSDPVPRSPQLLPELRKHQDRSDEGGSALACQEAPGGCMHGVRIDRGSARPPQGQEPGQQRSDEPADPLLVLPLEAALGGGPPVQAGKCGEGRGHGCSAWGQYAPAIHRWEILLGRIAPSPTEISGKGQPRLSPRAVEFMMGLPEGWVCAVPGLSRNDMLRILGNGVVPQQGSTAIRSLLPHVPDRRLPDVLAWGRAMAHPSLLTLGGEPA
jgi:DNA (cytosine-5)-methyltransferase 1